MSPKGLKSKNKLPFCLDSSDNHIFLVNFLFYENKDDFFC